MEIPEPILRMQASFSARDFDAAAACLDPDVVWQDAPELPDSQGVLRGREAVRDLWVRYTETLAELVILPVTAEEAPAGLLVRMDVTAVGKESGIAQHTQLWSITKLQHGLIVENLAFLDEGSAREAAGLG